MAVVAASTTLPRSVSDACRVFSAVWMVWICWLTALSTTCQVTNRHLHTGHGTGRLPDWEGGASSHPPQAVELVEAVTTNVTHFYYYKRY